MDLPDAIVEATRREAVDHVVAVVWALSGQQGLSYELRRQWAQQLLDAVLDHPDHVTLLPGERYRVMPTFERRSTT